MGRAGQGPLFERRRFLAGAGAFAGALAVPWTDPGAVLERAFAAPAPRRLRRCVALGPNGVVSPGSSQDYRSNRGLLVETGTRWVRMWADWPSLQPENVAPDRGSAAWRLRELDAQIAQANADGIGVVLCSYRFPRWANETAELSEDDDRAYELQDRLAQGRDPDRRKPLEFKLPEDLSASSAWGRWVEFIARRYSGRNPARKGIVDFLEVCNEPNLQMWPQQGPGTSDAYEEGELVIAEAVARMFATARQVTADLAGEPVLAGPATADRTGSTRTGTSYDGFTRALLDELAAAEFAPGAGFAWSHHNFTDVEYDQGAGSVLGRTTNRVAIVRGLLAGRWVGWPHADPAQPELLLTEGGARLDKVAALYGDSDPAFVRTKQAELIERNWSRMLSEAEGAGVGMASTYLFHTDPNYDSGLCEADGVRRPAFSTWGALASEAPGAPAESADQAPPAAVPGDTSPQRPDPVAPESGGQEAPREPFLAPAPAPAPAMSPVEVRRTSSTARRRRRRRRSKRSGRR